MRVGRIAAAALMGMLLTVGVGTAQTLTPHPLRVGGWGWESYSLSYPFSYGGYWGAHYGGARGILTGAAPHYGNYGGWYARHYVIGTAPWPAWDHDRNLSWDERYTPSPWNFGGVSHLIYHPREDVNHYVPAGAGPYVPPNLGGQPVAELEAPPPDVLPLPLPPGERPNREEAASPSDILPQP